MAHLARSQDSETQAKSTDLSIDRPEPNFPWPDELTNRSYGNPVHPHFLFDIAVSGVRRLRSAFDWYVFHREQSDRLNVIEEYPTLFDHLERLFWSELGTRYTPEQRNLLLRSDLILVVVDKQTGQIAGYASSNHLPVGVINNVEIPVTAGCHEVVGKAFQRAKLGTIFGTLMTIMGRTARELFADIAVVLRTNNKYFIRTLEQWGEIDRSDQIDPNTTLNGRIANSAKIIGYMHTQLFGLSEPVPLGHPLKIQHTFEERITIPGVGPNEIIYLCYHTTLFDLLTGLLGKKKKQRPETGG